MRKFQRPAYARTSLRSKLGFEQLEARNHTSTSSATWTSADLSDTSGASAFVMALFGDDYQGPTPTGAAGTNGEASAWSYTLWDSNLDDGLDSGWRSLAMSINRNGDQVSKFVAGGASYTGFSVSTAQTFHSVSIIADVAQAGFEVDVRSLSVQFLHDGTPVDQVNLADVQATTMDQTSSSDESGVTVTTSANNVNGVYVSGQVRLQGAVGCYAGPTDLTATIAVS